MRAVYPQAAVETETSSRCRRWCLIRLAGRGTGAPPDRRQHDDDGFLCQRSRAVSAGRIPAIVCGPGSIDVAHKPDEYITRAELADGQIFLDRLLRWARSGP